MSIGGGSSRQTSTPQVLTPPAFAGLQAPLAQRLAGLMGFVGGAAGGAGTAARPVAGSAGTSYVNRQGQTVPLPPGAFVQDGQVFRSGTGRLTGNASNIRIGTVAPSTAQGGTTGGGTGITGFNAGPDGLGGIPSYQGPLTANIGANETSLLNMLMGKAKGTAKASPAEAALQEFIRRGLSGDAAVDNPFLQSYIEAAQRPTREALIEDLSRTLPGRFTQAGQFTQPQGSSAFDRAAAISTRGAANALGDIATNISYQQVQDAQGRGLDAAKALPGVTSTEVDTLIKNLQAQALPRLIQEQGIDRGLTLFQTRLDALLKTLGITAGVTQPTIANKSEGKSSQFNAGIK